MESYSIQAIAGLVADVIEADGERDYLEIYEAIVDLAKSEHHTDLAAELAARYDALKQVVLEAEEDARQEADAARFA